MSSEQGPRAEGTGMRTTANRRLRPTCERSPDTTRTGMPRCELWERRERRAEAPGAKRQGDASKRELPLDADVPRSQFAAREDAEGPRAGGTRMRTTANHRVRPTRNRSRCRFQNRKKEARREEVSGQGGLERGRRALTPFRIRRRIAPADQSCNARRALQAIARAALIRSARASSVSCCAGETASTSSRASVAADPRLSSQRGASSGENVCMIVIRLRLFQRSQKQIPCHIGLHGKCNVISPRVPYETVNG